MPSRQVTDIRFPYGGLVRKTAYQGQPPYTTPDCLNVWPFDALEGRGGGGSRPGLVRAVHDPVGGLGGKPVRMMANLPVVANDGFTVAQDSFEDSFGADYWTTASWIGTQPGIVDQSLAGMTEVGECGVVYKALPLDLTEAYSVDLAIVPYNGAHWGTYSIFAQMDNTTPNAIQNGIVVNLTMTGTDGTFYGNLQRYVNGACVEYPFATGDDGSALAGVFSVVVNGNVVKAYWRGQELIEHHNITAASGSRVGFGLNCPTAGGACLVSAFRCQYYSATKNPSRRTLLVASGNGKLYRERFAGMLEEVDFDGTFVSDRRFWAVDRGQQLFIADHGPVKVDGTDGVVLSNGVSLSASGVTDWTALGIQSDSDVVVISNGTGAVADGSYRIAAISTTGLTLASTVGGGGTCAYEVVRAPKVYDATTDAVSVMEATAGDVPANCRLICRYRDRIVLAKGHQWWMSRQGYPLDWDLSQPASDGARALTGASSDAGRIGEPITALIPHSDDYMIFACAYSLWVLRGDAGYGGQMGAVSRAVGVVDAGAWCWGPKGELYFLSHDGVYVLPAGAQGPPISVSRERLPKELMDVDPEKWNVSMAYDGLARKVHISLTPIGADCGAAAAPEAPEEPITESPTTEAPVAPDPAPLEALCVTFSELPEGMAVLDTTSQWQVFKLSDTEYVRETDDYRIKLWAANGRWRLAAQEFGTGLSAEGVGGVSAGPVSGDFCGFGDMNDLPASVVLQLNYGVDIFPVGEYTLAIENLSPPFQATYIYRPSCSGLSDLPNLTPRVAFDGMTGDLEWLNFYSDGVLLLGLVWTPCSEAESIECEGGDEGKAVFESAALFPTGQSKTYRVRLSNVDGATWTLAVWNDADGVVYEESRTASICAFSGTYGEATVSGDVSTHYLAVEYLYIVDSSGVAPRWKVRTLGDTYWQSNRSGTEICCKPDSTENGGYLPVITYDFNGREDYLANPPVVIADPVVSPVIATVSAWSYLDLAGNSFAVAFDGLTGAAAAAVGDEYHQLDFLGGVWVKVLEDGWFIRLAWDGSAEPTPTPTPAVVGWVLSIVRDGTVYYSMTGVEVECDPVGSYSGGGGTATLVDAEDAPAVCETCEDLSTETFSVTFSGLTGDLATYIGNGTAHTVEWIPREYAHGIAAGEGVCVWQKILTHDVTISLINNKSSWGLLIWSSENIDGKSYSLWSGTLSATICDPAGSYICDPGYVASGITGVVS